MIGCGEQPSWRWGSFVHPMLFGRRCTHSAMQGTSLRMPMLM